MTELVATISHRMRFTIDSFNANLVLSFVFANPVPAFALGKPPGFARDNRNSLVGRALQSIEKAFDTAMYALPQLVRFCALIGRQHLVVNFRDHPLSLNQQR